MSRPRKNRLKKNKARAIRKARANRQRREGLRAAARQSLVFPDLDGLPVFIDELAADHCPICAGDDEDCELGCVETVPLSPSLPTGAQGSAGVRALSDTPRPGSS